MSYYCTYYVILYICIYIYLCIYVYSYIYIHMYICIYIYVCGYIYIILYYSILYYIILYCIVWYYIVLYCIILLYIINIFIIIYIYTWHIMLHMCSYYTAHVLLGGLSASHENKASSSTRTGTRLETIASWTILLPNQPQLLGSFGIHTYIYMYIIYRSTVQNHCWWSTIWDYTRQSANILKIINIHYGNPY